MTIIIESHGDVVRRTCKIMAAVGLTAIVTTCVLVVAVFGTDISAPISVGRLVTFGVMASGLISVALSGALTYRTSLVMLELAHTRHELARMSETDQLTGLLNRRGFVAAAAAALANAKLEGQCAAVLMCDIDHFKSINDRYGHDIGDKVLVEIADILRQFGRRHDALVARYGGEEFAAVLTGRDADEVARDAEEIRCDCAERTILDGVTRLPVTISIGFTVKASGFDFGELMRNADHALYSAKHLGRDRVEYTRDVA